MNSVVAARNSLRETLDRLSLPETFDSPVGPIDVANYSTWALWHFDQPAMYFLVGLIGTAREAGLDL